jgi:hypothetical protein
MAHLPTQEDQQWVIQNLATLVRRRGPAALLEAPLIEASDEYFPGAWHPDVDGARTMVERLLGYAGLGAMKARVVLDELEQHDPLAGSGLERRHHSRGAAAWFTGIDGDTCFFGLKAKGLRDPEELVGTLCHEVAHAYRHVHHLPVEGPEEEWLTDLTSIFLGFGVFVCNNAYRFRTREHVEGSRVMYGWSATRIGYLPLELLCFALAAQVVAREGRGRHRVRRLLETNQSAAFEKSFRYLQQHREALLGALRLAPRETGAVPVRPRETETVQRLRAPRGLLGTLAFWSGPREICSNPACQATLPGFVTHCPQCRGRIEPTQAGEGARRAQLDPG